MIILAHRGWLRTERDQNSAAAFERAFAAGFGVETDLRDLAGNIVVSHDPPLGGELAFEALLSIADRHPGSATLALNIKADGLQSLLAPSLSGRRNYFLFDMAVPDLVASVRHGLACFTRQSDVEREPVLLDDVVGVWLDSFASPLPDIEAAAALGAKGKRLAFVSPELHHRAHEDYWAFLRAHGLHLSPRTLLCTDFPDLAARYFGGGP